MRGLGVLFIALQKETARETGFAEIVSDDYPIFHARDATCFGYSRSSWIGTHSPRDKFVPKKSGDTGLQSAATFP
jgi:hypothetical protein